MCRLNFIINTYLLFYKLMLFHKLSTEYFILYKVCYNIPEFYNIKFRSFRYLNSLYNRLGLRPCKSCAWRNVHISFVSFFSNAVKGIYYWLEITFERIMHLENFFARRFQDFYSNLTLFFWKRSLYKMFYILFTVIFKGKQF